jgi:hypothetical protein
MRNFLRSVSFQCIFFYLVINISVYPQNLVVVELFTSEGCSSCPPADQAMTELQKEYSASNKPVYFIAYHVDYWNYLGWKDMFSSPAFTSKQKEYADAMSLRSIYTPQSVINGTKEMVGSKKQLIKAAIESELAIPNTNQLILKANYDANLNKIKVDYKYTGNTKDQEIHFILIEKEHSTKVLRGENEGNTLEHINIVKHWEHILVKVESGYELILKDKIKISDFKLIAFVQSVSNRKISIAAEGL